MQEGQLAEAVEVRAMPTGLVHVMFHLTFHLTTLQRAVAVGLPLAGLKLPVQGGAGLVDSQALRDHHRAHQAEEAFP